MFNQKYLLERSVHKQNSEGDDWAFLLALDPEAFSPMAFFASGVREYREASGSGVRHPDSSSVLPLTMEATEDHSSF